MNAPIFRSISKDPRTFVVFVKDKSPSVVFDSSKNNQILVNDNVPNHNALHVIEKDFFLRKISIISNITYQN